METRNQQCKKVSVSGTITMRVFVWISNGQTKVYSANTNEELIYLMEEINKWLKIYDEPEFDISLIKDSRIERIMNNCIHSLIDSEIDIFEYGSGFTDVILLQKKI